MKNWKLWTRTLLIAAAVLGAAWTLAPVTVDAMGTDMDPGETWELTGDAIQENLNGACENMGTLNTCRERCIWGSPTGDFDCFPH